MDKKTHISINVPITPNKTKLTKKKRYKARQRTNLSWDWTNQLIIIYNVIQTQLKTSVDKKVTHFNQCTNKSKQDKTYLNLKNPALSNNQSQLGLNHPIDFQLQWHQNAKSKFGQWTLNSHISIKIPISPKKIKLT